ncbi:MAG: multidrug resistance efflux transporter family protein [Bacillota bacterium]|nr:multidrug resistance efflux transporter family protein [Bacillota bacterium]
MKRALLLGIIGSFFFAFTFVLNRSMNLSGGYWLWSAALRYFLTLPMMAVLLLRGKQISAVLKAIGKAPVSWMLWSTVGFGLFYAPLSAASVYAESWFTAATWQLTIVAGILLTPLFGKKIPVKNLLLSGMILLGIFIMQIPQIDNLGGENILAALGLILIAAFSYPLGNRKMMQVCEQQSLSTVQRTFGMTLCSMPFWVACGICAGVHAGVPSGSQILQSLLVALFSGVIATILFFKATDLVKNNQKQLAVIEATQSGEVIFTLLLGILILHDAIPSALSFAGILLVIVGMILNSIAADEI